MSSVSLKSSKQLEKDIKKQILHWLLHDIRCFAWITATTGLFDSKLGFFRTAPKRGVPDILGVYRSKAFGIEVKTATGRLRPDQKDFAEAFQLAGGVFILARSLEEAQEKWSEKFPKV